MFGLGTKFIAVVMGLLVVLISGLLFTSFPSELPKTPLEPAPEERTKTCTPTGQDVQGPFYLPGAPFRTKLAPLNEVADKLIIKGKVLGIDCQPLVGAIVDVWHTDAKGEYDFSDNFWYRGKVKTGSDGDFEFQTYKFETVRPGRYPLGSSFRPAHIHIKAFFPGYKLLTTQLYFKGDPYLAPNDPCTGCRSDDLTHIIDLEVISNEKGNKTWQGIFDMVLERGDTSPPDVPAYK